MGLTTEGTVDFARNAIDVSGTFVPAYAVNTLLGKIPLVGVLLGGGKNEGLFAISYRAQGPLNDPKLTISPLSAIAPGILRKISGRSRRHGRQVLVRSGGGGADVAFGAFTLALIDAGGAPSPVRLRATRSRMTRRTNHANVQCLQFPSIRFQKLHFLSAGVFQKLPFASKSCKKFPRI